MKKALILCLASAAFAGLAVAQATGDYPPDAGPGTCFARVMVPEKTETVTEQVIDRPEQRDVKVIPATYQTVTEQVLVREESVEYTTTPPTYKTIEEQVIETPERVESVVVPAVFDTYSEKVLVREAYVTWKPGEGLYGRAGQGETRIGATGEVLCRVEVPAEYENVKRTRVVTPERTEKRVIPATYRTVTKQVVNEPAKVMEKRIPAEYKTMTVQKLVSPAREESIVIPATYKTVERRVVTGGGGLEWRQVLCDTNASSAKIAEIQRALTARGFAVKDDGDFGPATLRAMESFQKKNNLEVGYLTIATVRALGVDPG